MNAAELLALRLEDFEVYRSGKVVTVRCFRCREASSWQHALLETLARWVRNHEATCEAPK